MGIASVAAVAARPASSSIVSLTRQRPTWVINSLAFCSSSSSSSSSSTPRTRKLVLYSKPGCCLCDGLKEKLQDAFLLSSSNSLHDVDLQVRDITSNPEWQLKYQYEIPVLAKVLSDGTEVELVTGSFEQIREYFQRCAVYGLGMHLTSIYKQEKLLKEMRKDSWKSRKHYQDSLLD